MKIFDLFSGCGGFRLAAMLNSFESVGYSEINKYAIEFYNNVFEKELKEDIYCENQECGCDDFEECLKCTKEHILDIINKVKGEEF